MTKKLEWQIMANITNGTRGLTVQDGKVKLANSIKVLPTEEQGSYTPALHAKLDSANNLRDGIASLGTSRLYMMCVLVATREVDGRTITYAAMFSGDSAGATRTYQDADGSVVSSNIRTFDSLLEAMDACETWEGNQDPVA